ncbi:MULTISPECIES: phage holin family protein [Peptoniphilus]|uniref:phage holin family protein n=1 Tax=Peptoniphilus TaxID=162289 RepID=UPI00028902FB|nr:MULTISPECIES: phage holin family protein [Peptoniphilus]MBS6610450.1 phage holin family protein [Peptoniphilus harei]MDU1043075.1 phage holin family protein [Peptoniphilus rhinitidis]MDU1954829.1 phage holin family protein [Peptoniphilus lacydonensis]MDU2110777.1 phage holin family protein [Peptoniphilus lacydonensis]MDU2114801.1 phage holin family protein [Peptoniphilus lacydonensis]
MKKLFGALVANFLSFYILDLLFDKIHFANAGSIVAMAIIFALVNMTIKPILKVLSLPITIVTLGIFSLVVNAIVLEISFSLAPNSSIGSFGTAFWASIVLSFLNNLIREAISKNFEK